MSRSTNSDFSSDGDESDCNRVNNSNKSTTGNSHYQHTTSQSQNSQRRSHQSNPSSHLAKNINELLKNALEEASMPRGEEDEDPIILEAPGGGGIDINGKDVKPNDSDDESGNNIMNVDEDDEKDRISSKVRKEKQKAIEEEERKVAEMKFDFNALLPLKDQHGRMEDRAKYIPLRLTYEERKDLRLVNSTIAVSNYTNAVDLPFKNKMKRRHAQLQAIVSFLTGLVAAQDYEQGQNVITDRNFCPYEGILQNLLEISRRYKITNPEKMRSEYGKLVYLMQDADTNEIKQLLGIEITKPICTVYSVLKAKGGLAILTDNRIATATEEILPNKNKSRHDIQLEIRRKERAAEAIVKSYSNNRLSEDTIRLCLYSISDNNSFLNSNLKPIQECISLLEQYFHPKKVESSYSLGITEGVDGARLTHNHENQYNYVLQSLTLWAAIIEDMFRLWYLAELDLLSPTISGTTATGSRGSGEENSMDEERRSTTASATIESNDDELPPYELRNTGQGLQRVKQSPLVYRAMHEILARTKYQLGGWVGSSVIHLGDNNVPNTLMFIDKYTQVPRILGPLIKTLENIESACDNNEGLTRYMKAYGGIEKAKKDILHDFFTHAFDGSGGDNFFDAGSCIDGRLTSAWHWCSQLSNKPYYPLFRLTGFLSFDGQFDS